MTNNELRLLDEYIQRIGAFRFLQLSIEIDGNNWRLAKKYDLHPHNIVFIRQAFFEYRIALKPDVTEFINETVHIQQLTERIAS